MSQTILKTTNCPHCGGQMRFDPKTQQTVCSVCGRAMEEPSKQQEEELTCPNCGAPLTVIKGASQAECKSCDSVFSIVPDDALDARQEIPESNKYIDPFNIAPDDYQKGMITWLSRANGVPVDIFDKIAIISTEGSYVPYYYCTIHYNIQWTASIGHDRTETYTDFVKKTENGVTHSIPETRRRTVTDWTPYSSSSVGRMDLVCEASDYLNNTADKMLGTRSREAKKIARDNFYIDENFEHCVYGQTAEKIERLDGKYTAGFKLIPFDAPVSKVYDSARVNKEIYARIAKEAPGDKISNISFHGDMKKEYYVIYRPYWITKYSYEDKAYLNICDGNDLAGHMGSVPKDQNRHKGLLKIFLPLIISASALFLFVMIAAIISASAGVPTDGSNIANPAYDFFIGLGALAFIVTVIFGIIGLVRWNIASGKHRNAVLSHSTDHFNNPRILFDRKSAVKDPTI